jgi:hypothetical protein
VGVTDERSNMAARCAAALLLMQQGEYNKVHSAPERVFKDSLDPLNVPDTDLIKSYRLPRHMIVELCIKLKPILERQTGVNHVFSVPTQVLIGLGYLATGNYKNKNLTGISQASFVRILDAFITALSSLVHKYVRFPLGNQEFIANTKSGMLIVIDLWVATCNRKIKIHLLENGTYELQQNK